MPEVTVGIKYIIENMSEIQQQFGQIAEQAMQIATGPTAAGIGPSVPTPLPPHASAPTPWGPRAADDEIGMFPGARSTMPPYAGGSSAPPMGAGGNIASAIVIQTVNTLTISRVENLSIAGVGAGGAGYPAAGGGAAAAGAGAPSAFDPNQTVMPGDWPPGASVPAADAGGSAPTGTRAAGGSRRMRFGMYSTPYQYNRWAYQEMQDSAASGDPYRMADAAENFRRSQEHLQNVQRADMMRNHPTSQPEGIMGLVRGVAGGMAVGQMASTIAGNIGIGQQALYSGGDVRQQQFQLQQMGTIPLLGGIMQAIVAPGMQKDMQVQGLLDTARFMGVRGMPTPATPGFDQIRRGLMESSPTALSMMQQMTQQGFEVPMELLQRFRMTEAQAIRPGRGPGGQMTPLTPGEESRLNVLFGAEFGMGAGGHVAQIRRAGGFHYDPNFVPSEVRPGIVGAFERARTSPYAMAQYGYGEVPDLTSEGGPSAMQSMARLSYSLGDFGGAQALAGLTGDTALQRQIRDQGRSSAQAQLAQQRASWAQQTIVAGRAGVLAGGFTAMGQQGIMGTYAAERGAMQTQLAQLEAQDRLAQQRAAEARARGDGAGAQAAYDASAALQPQIMGIRTNIAASSTQEAQTPLTTTTRVGLSRAAFTIDVLQNIPGAYGNIRGAYLGQIGLLENAANELFQMRQAQAQQPGGITREADLQYQERAQDIMRQQAAAFQAASYGWEGRLIQSAINAPGNFNMVVSRFSLMDAVTRGGVRNPHMGATHGQLPAFMRFAGILNWPSLPFGGQTGGPMGVPGIPGMGGDPAQVPGGGPPNFFPPGGGDSGGNVTPGPLPGRGGGFPGGGPVLPAPPGGGGRGPHGTGPQVGSAGGPGGAPPVNVTVNITLDGKQIASKSISGAAGQASAVQNGLAQGGADDMIAQMGYSTARQS